MAGENRRDVSGVTRREVLRTGAGGVSALAAMRLLGACGSGRGAVTALDNGANETPSPSLAPFDADGQGGSDSGLPRRLAWASTSGAEFFVALAKGMEAASKDRDVEFVSAVSGNDPSKNISQLESFLARGIGCLAVQPLDQATQQPIMEKALEAGICVQGIISHPSTLQIAASQYTIGFTQGQAAADYATGRLGGKAEVHYFNLDTVSSQLKLRHAGVLDGLRTAGSGVKVVSDVTATDISVDGGFSVMSTAIEAHPRIKIVLGGDTLVVGAFRALKQADKLSDDMYLSGVDGDSQALALVREGGPYRASIAFAWRLLGYGLGQFGSDWIEGRPIPRVMVAAPLVLDSSRLVDTYLDDNAQPAAVFGDRARYERYLPLLGNVSYATRQTVWRDEFVPR